MRLISIGNDSLDIGCGIDFGRPILGRGNVKGLNVPWMDEDRSGCHGVGPATAREVKDHLELICELNEVAMNSRLHLLSELEVSPSL
jgi:hypothetical protein